MVRQAFLAVALLAVASCAPGPAKPAARKTGPVVAQGGGITVTADELKARLDEQSPMIRSSFQNLDRKKQFLDNLLRFELLARAAEKEGLRDDPDVQFTLKKVMVSKYYQRFFQGGDPAKGVGDDEVKKYFEEHRDEFHRPARVHVAHVFLRAEGPARAKRAAEAKKLLAKVLADEKKNPAAFATAARESSDDAATKAVGGDLGMRTREELEKTYGPAVAEAAFQLQDLQTSPTVLETKDGFHLLRVNGRQVEVNRTLDEVKSQIAVRLGSQKKAKEFEDFVKKLRDDAQIQVNDAELEKVAVAPAPAGPGPFGAAPAPAPAPGAPRP